MLPQYPGDILLTTLPPRPHEPHYLLLRDDIAASIALGHLPPGSKLPSERSLHEVNGSARGTIREALTQLEAEGLIYRKERSGWYVSPKPILYDPTRAAGFMTYVTEQGRTPATETLRIETIHTPPALAEIFGGNTPFLYRLERRRSIDGRAVLVEDITLDPARVPDLEKQDLNASLTRILNDVYGLNTTRNRIEMRACALVREPAEHLGVKSGVPGLLVLRTSFDAKGCVVEYDQEYWRADAIRIAVDLAAHD